MAFTTFTGPIRAGTVRYGSTKNTGLMTMAVSNTLLHSNTTAKTLFWLPAGSQIIRFVVDATVAFNAGTNNVITIQNASAASLGAVTATADNIAVGRHDPTVTGAQIAQYVNVGATDYRVDALFAGTGTTATTGTATITCIYVQRMADGSQNPTNA